MGVPGTFGERAPDGLADTELFAVDGTHVLSTAEVGRVQVTGTESKGKDNTRIRLEVVDA